MGQSEKLREVLVCLAALQLANILLLSCKLNAIFLHYVSGSPPHPEQKNKLYSHFATPTTPIFPNPATPSPGFPFFFSALSLN